MKDELMKYVNMMGKGVTAVLAPTVMGGMLVEIFRKKNVTTDVAIGWVKEDKSLWEIFGPEYQRQCRHAVAKLGTLDWMTADWAINAFREGEPALCSLFLGWKKGFNWMARQIDTIKNECQGG